MPEDIGGVQPIQQELNNDELVRLHNEVFGEEENDDIQIFNDEDDGEENDAEELAEREEERPFPEDNPVARLVMGDPGNLRQFADPNPRRLADNPFQRPGPRPARGQRAMLDGDGRELPMGVVPPIRRDPPAWAAKAVEKKPKVQYIDGGIEHKGFKFSRNLSDQEDRYLRNFGYKSTLKKFPDLVYVEKEVPLNNDEECIIIIPEVADYLATTECEQLIVGFDIRTHNKEYQESYKKFVKVISSFKRNKNG